jgi:hypothetical protein
MSGPLVYALSAIPPHRTGVYEIDCAYTLTEGSVFVVYSQALLSWTRNIFAKTVYLFLACPTASIAGQEPVNLDVAETNGGALAPCRKYRMVAKFETARMYTGQTPDIDRNKVYGITTFELG